jgi:hypothetical protein
MPSPVKPMSIIAQVEVSGTAVGGSRAKAAVKGALREQ